MPLSGNQDYRLTTRFWLFGTAKPSGYIWRAQAGLTLQDWSETKVDMDTIVRVLSEPSVRFCIYISAISHVRLFRGRCTVMVSRLASFRRAHRASVPCENLTTFLGAVALAPSFMQWKGTEWLRLYKLARG